MTDDQTPEADDPGEPDAPAQCPNGHDVAPGQRFCGVCGAPMYTPPPELLAARRIPPPGEGGWLTRVRQPKVLITAAAAALVLVLAGGAYLLMGGEEETNTITGTFSVVLDEGEHDAVVSVRRSSQRFDVGQPCDGGNVADGYGDIRQGTDVVVRDGEGEIIATGALDEGEWADDSCILTFQVEDVPKAKFYEVSVGRRGEQRYSHEEFAEQGFLMLLSIGG